MADPLFLSFWLNGFSPLALPLYFRKTLDVFPFSTLSPGSILRVYAVSFQEVPVFEGFIDQHVDTQEATSIVQEFLHEDCCFQLETRWDIWQWDEDWSLRPARARIEVCGPKFEPDVIGPTGEAEHVRIDLGWEDLFLPAPKSDQLRPVQSNIRSIVHLATDIEATLSVRNRLLWSENEDNFADRLAILLDETSSSGL
jgi:hypothetical protein